mmetsp:Transcript_92276/g.296676  ORF Transcript_92276/g.296676 Transcript_92276/m.296676 type:complete len:250 (+) Transcript_92276:615-1364(+)
MCSAVFRSEGWANSLQKSTCTTCQTLQDLCIQEPYSSYAESVVLPPYDDMLSAGLLASRDGTVASRSNFLNVHLLRDEAMATAAWRCLQDFSVSDPISSGQPWATSMVFLVGFKHVMFEYGVVGRLLRLCSQSHVYRVLADAVSVFSVRDSNGGPTFNLRRGVLFSAWSVAGGYVKLECGVGFVRDRSDNGVRLIECLSCRPLSVKSVILNPTPDDTLSQSEDELKLTLPLKGLAKPSSLKLADFVWAA